MRYGEIHGDSEGVLRQQAEYAKFEDLRKLHENAATLAIRW